MWFYGREQNERCFAAISGLNKYEALAILYLEKQGIDGVSPEELVTRFLETQDRIIREFNRQTDSRSRRLNPMPL
jgi:hypothetical protein